MNYFKLFIILFFYLMYSKIHAQNLDAIDSLKVSFNHASDTSKVLILDKIATLYEEDYPDSALIYLKKGLDMAKEISFLKGEAFLLSAYGRYHLFQGDFLKSIPYFNESLKLAEVLKDSSFKAEVQNNLGVSYFRLGDYNKASDLFINSLEIKEELRSVNPLDLAPTYDNVGAILKNLGDYEMSLKYFKKSLSIKTKELDSVGLGYSFHNLSILFKDGFKDFDSARYYYNKAIAIRKAINSGARLAQTFSSYGIFHHELKNYDSAIIYYDQAIRLAKRHNSAFTEIYATQNKARTLYYKTAYEASLSLVQMVESGLDTLPNLKINKDNQFLKSRVFEKLGAFERALSERKRYQILKDSLVTIANYKTTKQLEAQYQVEKKEQEIQNLTQQATIQSLQIDRQNLIIYGIIGLIILFATIFLFYTRWTKLRSLEQKRDLEHKLLRTQMNPHFLYNSLMAIQEFIYRNQKDGAGAYIAKFSRLMRLILENSREDFIPLNQEVETLEYYLELQQLRFKEKFDYKIIIDQSICKEEVGIPPMFAQPFIENAIEHGLLNQEEKGKIIIRFEKERNRLRFSVEDNGSGLRQTSLAPEQSEHKSLATQITKERLSNFYNGKLQKANFIIRNILDDNKKPKGAQVSFYLPVR